MTIRKTLLLICGLLGALPAIAGTEPYDDWRLEASANAFREGETIEFGVVTPALFQFRQGSRHHWSLFASAGAHGLANQRLAGQSEVEEDLLNLELSAGLFASGRFHGDMLYQYGKLAATWIDLDEDIAGSDDAVAGALLESGLEFSSRFSRAGLSGEQRRLAIHLGLRWRFGFDPLDGLEGKPDPIEGISFVIGTRLSL